MIIKAEAWSLIDTEEYCVVVLPEQSEFGAYTVKKMNCGNRSILVVAEGKGRTIDGNPIANITTQWSALTFHQDPLTKNWVIV